MLVSVEAASRVSQNYHRSLLTINSIKLPSHVLTIYRILLKNLNFFIELRAYKVLEFHLFSLTTILRKKVSLSTSTMSSARVKLQISMQRMKLMRS